MKLEVKYLSGFRIQKVLSQIRQANSSKTALSCDTKLMENFCTLKSENLWEDSRIFTEHGLIRFKFGPEVYNFLHFLFWVTYLLLVLSAFSFFLPISIFRLSPFLFLLSILSFFLSGPFSSCGILSTNCL